MPGRYYHYTKQAELTVTIERVQKHNVTAGEIGRSLRSLCRTR